VKGVIVCSGSISDYTYLHKYFEKADLVICADGGAFHLRNFGIIPDILVGDLDSIRHSDFEFLKDAGVEIIKYPVQKDMTDAQLAVELAIQRGCKTVVMIGALGSRLDHSISNVNLLKRLLDADVKGIIVNEHNEAVLIDSHICLQKEDGIKMSLLPLTTCVTGVTTKGLYYPLENATMEIGSTWGVSNEFSEDTASVSITGGLLLVIKSRD
jgi:thiamine pyrophosphokinase